MKSSIDRAGRHFIAYLLVFAATWTTYVWLGYRHVQALGEESLAYAAVNNLVRLTIWVLPVFIYLRALDGVRVLPYLKLAQGWERGLGFGLGLAVLVFANWYLKAGAPHFDRRFITWNSVLSTSFGIGFFEEIPFRGFILQKLAARINFWLANLGCSLIFVGLHLPGWIMLHLFSWPVALNVFVFSFVLGAVFRVARSLWACIIAHSANDFMAVILFHGH